MNVSCPECRSIFRVDPSKVPASGVRARCSVCGGIITVGAGGSIGFGSVSVTFGSGLLIPRKGPQSFVQSSFPSTKHCQTFSSCFVQSRAGPGSSLLMIFVLTN